MAGWLRCMQHTKLRSFVFLEFNTRQCTVGCPCTWTDERAVVCLLHACYQQRRGAISTGCLGLVPQAWGLFAHKLFQNCMVAIGGLVIKVFKQVSTFQVARAMQPLRRAVAHACMHMQGLAPCNCNTLQCSAPSVHQHGHRASSRKEFD